MDLVTILCIVGMVVGLVGMIVCGKMQRANPAMQPISIGLFVVVLICGFFVVRNMVGGGSGSGIIENEKTYYRSRGYTIAKELTKKNITGKVLVLVDPSYEQDLFSKALVEEMGKGLKCTIVTGFADVPDNLVETGRSYLEVATAKKLDAVVARETPDAVVVLTGLPADARNMTIFKKGTEKPVVLVSLGSANRNFVKAKLKSGNIIAIIEGKRGPGSEVSAPRDLEEAFKLRNELYTQEKAEEFK